MSAQLIGALNAATSLVVYVTYLPCLKVIGLDRDLKHKSCFRIMFHLGISDLLLVLIQFVFALLTLTATVNAVSPGFNCHLAAFAGSSWFSNTTLLLLLSANRLSAITNRFAWLSSNTCTTVLIVLSWLYSAGWLVVLELDSVGYCYYPSTYSFYYGLNTPLSGLAKSINWFHNQLTLWPAVLCYVIAFYVTRKEYIILKRRQVGDSFLNDRIREQEVNLLKQGAWIFGYHFVQSEFWHLAAVLHDQGFVYAFALANWMWLSNAGVNPAMYLTMNRTIYTKVKQMFGVEPKPNPEPNPIPKENQDDGAVVEDMEAIVAPS